MNTPFELRQQAVRHYLKGSTLHDVSSKYNIHAITLCRWIKWYKQGGEENLKRKRQYKKPWNRARTELEEKVVLLKESDPAITVRKAKEVLRTQNIEISIKGIWSIWQRYGYAGFNKENMTYNFTECCPWSKDAKGKFEQAKKMFASGKIKETAKILNSIPYLPQNELIMQIPDSYLNLRRQVEKILSSFSETALHSYVEKTKNLYNECMKRNLFYSGFRVGIFEILSLEWSGILEEQLRRIEELKKITNKRKDYYSYLIFQLRFPLYISEGIVNAHLSKTKKASEMATVCRRLLQARKKPSPYFMLGLGALYTNLEDYRKTEYWLSESLKEVDDDTKNILNAQLANICLSSGRFQEAIRILKSVKLYKWIHRSWMLYFRSLLSLFTGTPQKAVSLATESLSLSKDKGLNHDIFNASFTIASVYCSIGEEVKAKNMLRRVLPFFVKTRLKKAVYIIKILLSQKSAHKFQTLLNRDILPSVKLALLLKNSAYSKAFLYAKRKYLLSYFYRYTYFFPEAIINRLEKGKPTRLPKAILKLPVFNKKIPVYYIKFLGNLIVYKNQKYLNVNPVTRERSSNGVKLQPKDTAFLIHLVLKAGEPNKKIPLRSLYRNFWLKNKNPERNLSHLLVRVKKALKIPTHLLEVSYRKDNPVLINKGIYFTTDYQEFEQILAHAKALHRAGEWALAKKEYIRAFSFFRGEPFRKMYDSWSEQMRRVILNQLEPEAVHFAWECLKRGNKKDARKVLEKVVKIIPNSEEIKELVKKLNG